MEKVYNDPDVGEVILRKGRGYKRITLKVRHRHGVTVWVLETIERQNNKLIKEPQPSPERIEEWRAEAKRILPARLAELAKEYSFEYNQVRIKHNVSNWGSCSRKGNINLNLNLVRVPEDLRDYVLLHELCHLRHPNHGPEFHALLESLCPNHKVKEKELRKYRIL